MFSGLSAFPLTPLNETGIDEKAFVRLVKRLVSAGVDSIGALGSTGSYAYLSRDERMRVTQLAVENAEGTPVMVGIGALTTHTVLRLAEDAQIAGASAVLLAPVSYQKLTDVEVFSLYETVTRNLSIPLCIYDNPGTTHFQFSDELLGRIAQLPNVSSIKIPGVTLDPEEAKVRIEELRAQIPPHVTIGISGDPFAATGLNAGCEIWYSALGGLFPEPCLSIIRAAQAGDSEDVLQQSAQLNPLWELFRQYGSLRVIAAAAELQEAVDSPCLPLPLQALNGPARQHLCEILKRLKLVD
ncbi:dihydrodipicolinate synthase family protein [Paenibacillus sp. CAA11]|uniref:dihydrodipicolinate synthase family protein n=1 Tax=Paenibacillus sp. CAA11 TaxID=1532905 RepID=UPI000D3CEAF7|nr:dihydrodipicolinate synthase family protein [Paenibacillus sp. CAA11]AWB44809.1 dihydrodipicolinate synthase family protein [Paenibacillus sp. CAA11]